MEIISEVEYFENSAFAELLMALQMHGDDANQFGRDYKRALETLRAEGQIRAAELRNQTYYRAGNLP